MRTAAICLIAMAGSIACCSSVRADLANCFVYWRCQGNVGRACEKMVSQSIHNAYGASSLSADDLFFILSIVDRHAPGEYSINYAKLTLSEHWQLNGVRVQAGDLDGLLNGVREINKAFGDGRLFDMKPGKRDGLLDNPLYKQ